MISNEERVSMRYELAISLINSYLERGHGVTKEKIDELIEVACDAIRKIESVDGHGLEK